MTRLAVLITMVGGLTVLASLSKAQEPPPLDPAGVRGMRHMMRDDARTAAIWPDADTLWDWHAAGLTRPSELVTPAQVRTSFEGNIIRAERRFAQPLIINGALHSVARRADRQIVVTFIEGGLADKQRRTLAKLGARGEELDPTQILGGLTGGRIYAGATAVLSPEHEDAIAGWEPGAKVTLHCGSASNVPLAALLNDCVPQATIVAAADRLADAQSDLALAGRPLTVSPTPKRAKSVDAAKKSLEFLFLSYHHGLLARVCLDTDTAIWMNCGNLISKNVKSKQSDAAIQQTIRDLKSHFNLPGPVTPQSKTLPQRTTPEARR